MESLLLAKLFGLYFIIVGVAVTLRRKSIMPAVADLARNRALLLFIGAVELAAGLALIVSNPTITFNWMGIISVIGWMLAVEGLVYMAMPARRVQKFIRSFNKPEWYLAGGVLSVVAGAYLAGVGFGFI